MTAPGTDLTDAPAPVLPPGRRERRLRLAADPDGARRAAECARELLAGTPTGPAFACELAVAEACANVVEHAYGGRPAGALAVVLRVRPGWFAAAVCDEGGGFRPDAVPDLPEAGRESGRGLPLMAACMDRLAARRVGCETRLLMVRRLEGVA